MKAFALVLFAVVVAAIAASLASAAQPRGCYSGSYMLGTVKGTATFGVPGKFSLKLDAMGEQIDCPSISYSVDHSTGQLSLPQASDKRTCLGKVLADAQLPTPKVKFDGNKLSLDLGLAKLDLTPCS